MQGGFTYLGVLVFVAVMGVLLGMAGTAWDTQVRREKEEELLFVGDAYRKAIRRYFHTAPGGFPRELSDLVKDPRRPDTQRYVRKLYADPITGSREWGLIKTPDGGIAGVYSLSEKTPFKQANFAGENMVFEGSEKYSQWQFVYFGGQAAPLSAQKRSAAPPGVAADGKQ